MADWPRRLTPFEIFLGFFTRLRPGEGRSVLLYLSYALLMIGATSGSLAAPALSGALFPVVGPWPLMLAAMALLAMTPPRLSHRLEDRVVPSGVPFKFQIPDNTFIDPDEGDVIIISAHQVDDDRLPAMLVFDPETLGFSGTPPVDVTAETRIILRATDFDGVWAEGELVLRHSVEAAPEKYCGCLPGDIGSRLT